MVTVVFDYAPIKKCKHPDWTYGEICVKCGECGRFNKSMVCLNCGKRIRNKPPEVIKDWGSVELYDVFRAPICPTCRPLFKEEDTMNFPDSYDFKIISIYKKDFVKRGVLSEKRQD